MRTIAADDDRRVGRRLLPKWRWLVVLAVVLLMVVATAAALPRIVRWQTRKLLDGLSGATADFSDARLSLIPLRYRISHLKIREEHPKTKEPLFYADEVALSLRWDRLLSGRLVGSAEASKWKLVLHEGPLTRLPPVEKVIPVRAELERFQLRQGEVLYVWVLQEGQPSMWFHQIEATVENVASRPGIARGPMALSARGKVQRSGTMTASVTADPYAVPFDFSGKAIVRGFDPSEMNGLISAQKGVKLSHGRFDMDMSFECRRGRVRGSILPRLEQTEIVPADGDLGSRLKALLGRVSMSVARPTEGTEPSGRIAVEDDLRDPKLQLLPVVEKVVENGLLLGLDEGVKRNTGPGKKDVDHPAKKPTDLDVKG